MLSPHYWKFIIYWICRILVYFLHFSREILMKTLANITLLNQRKWIISKTPINKPKIFFLKKTDKIKYMWQYCYTIFLWVSTSQKKKKSCLHHWQHSHNLLWFYSFLFFSLVFYCLHQTQNDRSFTLHHTIFFLKKYKVNF